MQLSKYYKKTALPDGRFALYNTLAMRIVYVTTPELSRIEHFELSSEDDVRLMLDCGIYVTDYSIDDQALEMQRNRLERDFGSINVVYIILTDACNLRCSYCAVKNIADKFESSAIHYLDNRTIDKFADGYLKHLREKGIDSFEVIFYGGEPLLNWQGLTHSVATIERLSEPNITPTFSVVTNGTLVNPEIAKYCKEHDIKVSLSLDGPKEITNQARKTAKGIGAYDAAMTSIETLEENGVIPSLSITVTKGIVDSQEKVFLWLDELSKKYSINSIAYNLLHFQDDSFNRVEYCREATKFILNSYSKFGNRISEDRFNRKIQSLLPPRLLFGDCATATGNQIVLKANGELSLCQAFCQSHESTVGNLNTESAYEILSHNLVPALEGYKAFLPINRRECLECEALFSCGGGCYWDSRLSGDGIDAGFCEHSKLMHERMVDYVSRLA